MVTQAVIIRLFWAEARAFNKKAAGRQHEQAVHPGWRYSRSAGGGIEAAEAVLGCRHNVRAAVAMIRGTAIHVTAIRGASCAVAA